MEAKKEITNIIEQDNNVPNIKNNTEENKQSVDITEEKAQHNEGEITSQIDTKEIAPPDNKESKYIEQEKIEEKVVDIVHNDQTNLGSAQLALDSNEMNVVNEEKKQELIDEKLKDEEKETLLEDPNKKETFINAPKAESNSQPEKFDLKMEESGQSPPFSNYEQPNEEVNKIEQEKNISDIQKDDNQLIPEKTEEVPASAQFTEEIKMQKEKNNEKPFEGTNKKENQQDLTDTAKEYNPERDSEANPIIQVSPDEKNGAMNRGHEPQEIIADSTNKNDEDYTKIHQVENEQNNQSNIKW